MTRFVSKIPLLDAEGRPLKARIQEALYALVPRLRRTFPSIRDEAVLTGILEEAGQHVAAREEREGELAKLHAYTWVTLKNLTISRLRQPAHSIELGTIGSVEGEALLQNLPAEYGSPESMERTAMLREALESLSPRERMIAIWKRAGFSTKEIAAHLGVSTSSVDTAFFRIRQKLRTLMGASPKAS
jgi:RNA polymerase sigma factor (sigma-70 family)